MMDKKMMNNSKEGGMKPGSGMKGQDLQQKKKNGNGIFPLILVLAAAGALLILYPENREPVLKASYNFFIELITILPAVMILMGLFAVWIKNEMVVKYLGHASGLRGFALALFLGMIPSGPLYVAFPMAASLLKKGARVANIIIFLSAWACIKLPQELVEMRFLGLKFMILRLVFTVIMVIVMGLFIEKAGGYSRSSEKKPGRNKAG